MLLSIVIDDLFNSHRKEQEKQECCEKFYCLKIQFQMNIPYSVSCNCFSLYFSELGAGGGGEEGERGC